MTLSLNEEIAIALALPLLMVVTQVAHSLYKQLGRYARVRCIVRISHIIMADEDPTDREIKIMRWLFGLGTIAESTMFISEYIYGRAHHRLMLITEICELDFLHFHNSELHDIATFIEAYPERAIQYIARLNSTLSWHEVAMITQILRRTGAPIAYTPLLTSRNRNLQLISIYICNLFAITDAEPHLQRLAKSEDEEIAYMALLTLCSIHGDISSPQIGCVIAKLAAHQRKAFIRHAVQSCYSLRSCAPHLSTEEQRLFSQQLNSHKCQLACN